MKHPFTGGRAGRTVAIIIGIGFTTLLSAQLPYQNSNLTPEQRATDLLQRLTLEEKASLMQNASPAIPRLGIRPYEWWNEALHGVARAGLATVFPQTIGMAASFNDSLLYKVFNAVSDEARAKNRAFNDREQYKRYQGLTMWTPNVNIFRDPRWGRGQETYGEDPYLASRMGVAVVKGLQGPDTARYDKLHACAKHFAVHSGPEWNRHSFNAENIAPRDLWETYLPAFKVLVQEADVKEVMCAYNRFEGDPCCGSNRLLTQILRNDWGFKGIIVSDCGAISDFFGKKKHNTHPDAPHASADAVLNGTDLECGGNYRTLPEAVKAGLISEEQINTSVKRLLKARFELGEMETDNHPWALPYSVVDCPEHRQLALQMARETMTLLQNKDNLLPLDKKVKVAVIGPNANDSVMQWGNYNGVPSKTATLLSAIQAKLPASQIYYEQVCGLTDDITLSSLFNQCSDNGKPGFSASYWNNKEFKGTPDATAQLSTPFRFTTLGATAFAPGIELTGFASRYHTVFRPVKSGSAIFRVQTNGNIKASVNGEEVLDQTNIKNPENLYTLQVEAGQSYDIDLQFTQIKDGAYFNFDLVEETPLNLNATLARLKDADVVIFAGGISPLLEGEEMKVSAPGFKGGDRTDIELPAAQRNVLAALKKAGKKIVFVNFSGSAMALAPEAGNCDAILQAWYPGQAGGTAVADVLFGDYNPAGRLPITFYKHTEQLPDFEDYSMQGRTYRYMKETPLFPFGYGLSYTTFSYGKAQADKNLLSKGDKLNLSIPIKNTGKRNGEEIVQVYIRRPADKEGPAKTLRAFKRVEIAQGKTENVMIELPYSAFEWFDATTNTMHPLSGVYEILYGSSSKAEDLHSLQIHVK
ncbi:MULTISPECIES: xylan 1,4-beta-xylosidase [Bacteroides]|uniref:xylan 1,4-beta-xylosidase n=1 Tax=Bacteroides TaxID=816 RepID=UPI00259CB305|nr:MULTISPECIES: xylan 1,4-beta-xylosidase [Bacteroides]